MRTGLSRVLADTPVRSGFAQALVGWAPAAGLTGRVELGYRPLPNLAGFAFGEWNSKLGPSAGAGVRLTW